MNKPMIVSDEYREGYAAFYNDVYANPYHMDIDKYDSWDDGRVDLVVSFILDEGHCDDEGTWFEETEAEITRVTIKAGEGR